MNQLNRVELIGYVGSCRETTVGESTILRFTVATNYAYKSKDGTPVIEVTWSSCVAFGSSQRPLPAIQKGSRVHVIGRMRNVRMTGEDGFERTSTEVCVSGLELITDDECLELEI